MNFACAGDNCIDYYDRDDAAFCGGNPVNVAVYIKRLGGDSSYTGAVGNDRFGRVMLDSLQAKGVDTSTVQVKDGATAVCHVEMKDGDRILGDYDEGVMADFTLDKDEICWLAGQDIVISGLWSHMENVLKDIKAEGQTVIAFDCADRPYDPVSVTASQSADILFFSDDSADDEELKSVLADLASRGPALVVATRGKNGSMAYDGRNFCFHGIIECELVDTMGAGDSYIAGFLYEYMKRRQQSGHIVDDIEACMKAGAESAAVTIGYSGAW
ncbi:MAG: fructoselysine 6-kinase [Parasporobacterium sp.]|nr:fructoselysine 6-kinase [Parasporobacterium sp.]